MVGGTGRMRWYGVVRSDGSSGVGQQREPGGRPGAGVPAPSPGQPRPASVAPRGFSVGPPPRHGPGPGRGGPDPDVVLFTHPRSRPERTGRGASFRSVRPRVGPSLPPGRRGGGGAGRRGGGRGPYRSGWRWVLWLVGLAVFGPVLAFAVGWVVVPAPSADDLSVSQIATVDYANGDRLATVRPDGVQNRVDVPLSGVPASVRYAVLAAEDRSFYTNPGFDITGIVRATWDQLRGINGGGSTITQQFIKNATGNDQHTLLRKYREIIQAAKLSRADAKDTILDDYLNTIYLGRGAYGIQAAAKAYFGVNTNSLSLSQGALLAGLIQSPSRWDPANDTAQASARWNYVLDGMLTQHWITAGQRATAQFPTTLPPKLPASGIPSNYLGHIYTQVKAELADLGISEQEMNQEGLKITTTIDPKLEERAARISATVLAKEPTNLRTALVAEDPRTGAILAYYGGQDGVGLDYAQVLKQPGSSFKPFVLTAALRQNPPIGLGSEYDGSSPQTFGAQTVSNSAGDSCAQCDLKEAMTKSINTIFYRLAIQIGAPAIAQAASNLGIPANLLDDPDTGIALGDKEVHPGDMTSAYATFADNGVRHAPHLITKVRSADGRVLYDIGPNVGEQVISAKVARNVTESMLDVAQGSSIPLSRDRPVAAKTGTTQSRITGQNNDAWTVGYTPTLSTAVWVGTDHNTPIKDASGRPIYGRMTAGSIWQKFMNTALAAEPLQQFSQFVPIGTPLPDNDNADTENSNSAESRDSNRYSDNADEGGQHHRHNQDGNSGHNPCNLVRCDDNGDPLLGGISEEHNSGGRGNSGGD